MTGTISAVTEQDISDNKAFIIADDLEGTFYGTSLIKCTGGLLVGFRAVPLAELMGKTVVFKVNKDGEAYSVQLFSEVLDNYKPQDYTLVNE